MPSWMNSISPGWVGNSYLKNCFRLARTRPQSAHAQLGLIRKTLFGSLTPNSKVDSKFEIVIWCPALSQLFLLSGSGMERDRQGHDVVRPKIPVYQETRPIYGYVIGKNIGGRDWRAPVEREERR